MDGRTRSPAGSGRFERGKRLRVIAALEGSATEIELCGLGGVCSADKANQGERDLNKAGKKEADRGARSMRWRASREAGAAVWGAAEMAGRDCACAR
jgi:hypothetical protein